MDVAAEIIENQLTDFYPASANLRIIDAPQTHELREDQVVINIDKAT